MSKRRQQEDELPTSEEEELEQPPNSSGTSSDSGSDDEFPSGAESAMESRWVAVEASGGSLLAAPLGCRGRQEYTRTVSMPSLLQRRSSDDEDGEAFEHVDVDFEFYDPVEKDFHGLKVLLTGLLDGVEWNCSELVDAIIKQVGAAN